MKRCKQLLMLASFLFSTGLALAQSNTPPVAFSQSLVSTQGSSLFIALTASDADGDTLTYRIATPPYLGYLTGAPPNVLYVCTTNFSTTVTDSFTFVANDGLTDSAPATISITLFPQTSNSNTLPVLSLISNDAVASEALNPDGTTNTATFSIQRMGNVSNDVSVSLFVHGSATYGSDYHTIPALLGLFSNSTTTVFMPAGSTSAVFTLYPIPDNATEGTEFAIFTINTNSSYALGSPSQITVSILDSNQPPVPSTRVIFPADGAVYASTLDIKLRVANSNLANLKLYADNQLLTSFTSAPTLVTFVTNFSAGSHIVYSVGNDSVTSAPVHFQVLAPLISSPLSPSLGIEPEANASFVIDSNGALFDFGDGRLGALADGAGPNQEPNNLTRPIQIPLPAGTNRFAKVSSGNHHTLALTADGSLWTSGDNSSGQTGQGKSTATFMGFVTIPEFPGWKDIAAGNTHSLVLDKFGRLTACGNNSSGQLGLGSTTNVSTFQFVPFPTNVTAWTAIGAGSNYSIALGNNGQLYACGLGFSGTLGTGGLTNSLRFVPVALPTGVTNWLKATAGAQHVLAVAGNGALYAWGLGTLGQLGNGSFSSSPLPHLVTPPTGVSNWLALAAGLSHSLGLGNDGNLYSWGSGVSGQLGPGSRFSALPVLVPPPDGILRWKTIAAGINHSLGIGDNCTLYAWGANNFGQLGIGSTTNQTNEVAVSNLGDLCAPPVVTITSPIDGAVFPASANILINAEATSHDGQISRIDLFENGILLASGTNTPFSFIWSNVVQGTYALTAAAADNINPTSISTSPPVNISVSSSSTLPIVSVVATDAQAAEPPPTNNGTFAFTRTGNTQLPLTVLFRISGTATLNTDYQTSPPLATGTSNTIYFRTIPTNSNSATITVIPLGDTNVEGTETVILTLFTNSAYTIGSPGGATVSILNNTNPPPPTVLNIVTTDSQAHEVPVGGVTDTANFTVTRTGTPNSVRFPITVSGSATYGVDYYTIPPFVVGTNTTFFDLGSNQTSVIFTLYPYQDNLAEGTETAIFTLGTNFGYTLGPSNQSVISIIDGPASPQLVQVIFPPDGSVFASPESINIKAAGTNALELRIYADDQLLAVSNPPTVTTFVLAASTNFSPGEHTVYAVGTNYFGVFSNTYTSPPVHFRVLAPLAVPMTPSIGSAPASSSSYVIDENGALFDWGAGNYAQLGDGINPGNQSWNVLVPEQIPLGDGTNRWVKVAGGAIHALALDSSGRLYSAGEFGSGQLGRPGMFTRATAFLPVPFPTNVTGWKDIAAGQVHSLGLTTDGELFAWGNNSYGQLGIGSSNNTFIPTLVPFPPGVTAWNAIGAGSTFSVALGNDANLYTCGLGLYGALGTGGTTNSPNFVQISLPTGITNWLTAIPGYQHVLAIAGNHALYAWGLGSSGQLGIGGQSNSLLPKLVSSPMNVSNWIALAAGQIHSLGLGDDGNLYSWGNNALDALGPGPMTRLIPMPVPPPTNVVSWKTIGAGLNHSLAIGSDCTLYTWGANIFGQLGIGSLVNQTNETPVENLNILCAPPFVTITSPIDGSVFPASANVLINAEATSHDGQISHIDLFENGVLLASGTNTPFSFTWSNVVQGTYVLTAAAADSINPASFSTSSPVSITVSSSNTLQVVSVVATDAQAAEPPPTNNGTFTFTRTGNTQLPLTVLFRISGTATLNTDYQTSPLLATGTSNTIYFRTIPTNSNSATITVIPLADTNVEGTETVLLTLFTNSAYTIGGPGSAAVNILDNTNPPPPPPPPPVLNLVTTDSQAYELTASGGIDTASFMVTRTGTSNFVRFPMTVSGTATYGVDYYTSPAFQVASNSSTTFFDLGTNQTSLTFTLYPIQDNLVEGTETAIFTLGTNVGYTLGSSNQSTISIFDGPAPPQLAGIVFPLDGAVFASPESINIRAGATNALELRIYADNQLIGSSNPPAGPATFVLIISTNFPPGQHTVYSVATNRFGLISNIYTSPPVDFRVLAPLVQPMAPSIAVASSASASYVIDGNGALFDWGSDSFGQLGDGVLPPGHAVTSVVLPQQIPLGDGTNRWVKVAGGADHALALNSSGRLYSTGENGSGQLGLGPTFDQSVFMPVPFPTNVLAWKEIAAGESHSLGLAPDGRLFSWGNNSAGQLGIGGRSSSFAPTFVPFPPGVNAWSAIAAGGNFSVALADNGRLYSCGSGVSGALGTGGTIDSLVFVPVSVPGGTTNSAGMTNWLAVTAAFEHVLAIAGNHALYAWGLGTSGQLGNGGFTNATVPTLVSPPAGVTNWLALAGGIYHSLALADNGELYGWGTNVRGVLGPGPVTRAVPTLVIPPAGVAVWKAVGAGFTHSLAISDNCALYAWGVNNLGQLGIGSLIDQTNEVPVQGLNALCAAFTNQPPIALSQFLVATQRTIVPITLTASDPDNDPLTYRISMPPSLGYLTGAPPNVLYISTTNFLTTVTDRFDFVANDGHTDSFPATVTLLLLPSQSSNNLPVVTITSTDALASEQLNPDGTTNTANFAISRAGATNGPLDVLLEVIGTAHYGVDYYTLPPLTVSSNSNVATVSIPAGSSSVPFTLYGSGRVLPNPPVTATFTIATSSGYTLGSPNQASISIINSNRPPIAPTRIFFPPDGSVFASPLNIELRVASTNVSTVKLYADGNLIGSTSAPPGSATFVFNIVTNFPAGAHTAYTIANSSLTSAPVHFFVSATNISSVHAPSLGVMPVANSSFVVDANGALFGWGSDGFANLGDGGLTSNSFFSAGVTLPIQIPLPASGAAWTKVASGGQHTLALDSLGNVYATGDNTYGQIGMGSSSTTFTNVLLTPTHFARSKDVAAGNFHSLALTTDGQIYAWGYNDFGQLGNGTTTNASFPRPVSFPPGVTNWTAVAAGVYHSLALGNDGNAYAWGYAEFGALGNGAFTNASIPQRVVLPAGVTNWLKIAAGGYHNLALAGNGKLYAWGYGGVGTLGYGGVTNVSVPVPVNAPSNVVNWAAISAGILHSLALAEDGSVYGWGDNLRGQLGPNAGSVQPVPFLITPPTGVQSWQQISAGAFHNLAIADSCMLYSWGSNSLGQLGIGSLAQQFSLQKVHNLDDLCIGIVTETNHAPSFVKGPDITVPENAGIQVFTNWATQINPGAPSETNQTLTFIVTNDNPHLFSTQPGMVPSGSLFFAGAPDSNGIAHVTVVLRDNGGTANGGQDTSATQSFVITIKPPNHAPVPVVRVFPLFILSSNYSTFQVISPNGSNAVVYFDASHSSDADGDPLTFAWFDNGTNHLFGSTVVATNVLALGTNSLILGVSDGHETVFDPFAVDVISVGDAVGELIGLLQTLASSHSGTKPNTWKQLIDSLQAAQSEFEKGLWNAGLVHMRIFEFRVLIQVAPSDPALANNLISIAQQIINAVQSNARHQPTIRGLQSQGSNHKSLSFTGTAGQIYLVQACSDLTHWETIGVASETDPGSFQFDDITCSNVSARYYRLVVP